MTVYRIEDKNGEGPFCHKDGTLKTDKTIKFNGCNWLYAFDDLSCFLRNSYKPFYNSPEYVLFEIKISEPVNRGRYDEHEIRFLPKNIQTKKAIKKEINHEQQPD